MAGNPKVALVAVVHALALDALFDGLTDHSALKISGTVCYHAGTAEGIDDSAAAKEQADATSAAAKGMPKNPEKLGGWLIEQDQKTLSFDPRGLRGGMRRSRAGRRRREEAQRLALAT
jgi:ParB family transcriptional regulator, chromosome partitioning protein